MNRLIKMRRYLITQLAEKTDIKALYWARRKKSIIEGYWELRKDESNQYLIDVLEPFSFQSLLELGSNCGARLSVLAQRWPEASMVGIDINEYAVEFGNKKLAETNLKNVKLIKARIEELGPFAGGSFDVCFTWASLIYIQPARILSALENMLRIAKKALVLLEIHDESLQANREISGKLSGGKNWARNYRLLFEQFGVPADRVSISTVPTNVWSPGGGGGACIIVRK